jgi:hypothetical protein
LYASKISFTFSGGPIKKNPNQHFIIKQKEKMEEEKEEKKCES